MKALNCLALAILSTLITGCTVNGYSKKFGCSGLPDGVVCKTPSQIYDMTNGDQLGVYQQDIDGKSKNHDDNDMFKSSHKVTVKGQASGVEGQMIDLFTKPQFQSNSNPMPVLEQPKVLRIWIAPWKDENETLNWGSFMFTEITPRRWNFGESVMRNTPITAPNQADFKSASETMTPEKAGKEARNATDKEVANINQSINNANSPKPKKEEPLSAGLQKQNEFVGNDPNAE